MTISLCLIHLFCNLTIFSIMKSTGTACCWCFWFTFYVKMADSTLVYLSLISSRFKNKAKKKKLFVVHHVSWVPNAPVCKYSWTMADSNIEFSHHCIFVIALSERKSCNARHCYYLWLWIVSDNRSAWQCLVVPKQPDHMCSCITKFNFPWHHWHCMERRQITKAWEYFQHTKRQASIIKITSLGVSRQGDSWVLAHQFTCWNKYISGTGHRGISR